MDASPRGLIGRRRYARATRRCVGLLCLFIFVSVAFRLQTIATSYAFYRAPGRIDGGVIVAVYLISYVVGGLAVDRLGVRRAVLLSLALWSGGTTLNASLADPVDGAICQDLLGELVLGPLAAAGFVAIARTFHPHRRAIAAVALQTVPFFWRYLLQKIWYVHAAVEPQMSAAATVAIGIALVWWFGSRALWLDTDPLARRPFDQRTAIASLAVFLARRETWALALLTASSLLCASRAASGAAHSVPWNSQAAIRWGPELVVLGAEVVALAAAVWSDRLLRRGRNVAAARAPILFAGFVATASIVLMSTTSTSSLGALIAIVVSGALVTQLAVVVAIDLAPTTNTGAFFGVLIALTTAFDVTIRWVDGWIGRGDYTGMVFVVAIVGAAMSLLVPHMRAIGDR